MALESDENNWVRIWKIESMHLADVVNFKIATL